MKLQSQGYKFFFKEISRGRNHRIFLGETKPMEAYRRKVLPSDCDGANVSENLGGTAVSLVSPVITP